MGSACSRSSSRRRKRAFASAAAVLDLSSDVLGILDSCGRVLHLNLSITAILVGLSNLHGYSY